MYRGNYLISIYVMTIRFILADGTEQCAYRAKLALPVDSEDSGERVANN